MLVLMYCSTKTISLCMWHMIVTCPNESVKIVTVEEMYKQCGLVCQFQLSVDTDSPEEHRLLVLVYHS